MERIETASMLALLSATVLLASCGGGGGGGGGGGTTPPVAASLTIATAGDIGDCGTAPPSASFSAKTAALVQPTDTLVLTLGDTVYENGTALEFANCFHPTWGAFKDRIRPTPGNHDYNTPAASGYYDYFGTLAGPDRRGYYSFDAGGWHFISLNSNVAADPASAQYQWLAADLAGSKNALCTIAYWHYPLYSSGPHGNIADMQKIWEALQAAGVDVVLVGHDHLYERFAAQDANGVASPLHGIREFVVGTGGAHQMQVATVKPNSEFRYDTNHGILRLVLFADAYTWQFLSIDGGAVIDSGRDTCHR